MQARLPPVYFGLSNSAILLTRGRKTGRASTTMRMPAQAAARTHTLPPSLNFHTVSFSRMSGSGPNPPERVTGRARQLCRAIGGLIPAGAEAALAARGPRPVEEQRHKQG